MKHSVAPGATSFLEEGVVVEVLIRPAQNLRDAMAHDKIEAAAAEIRGRLVIDTGAHITVIARSVAEQLGVQEFKTMEILDINQELHRWPVYWMGLTIQVLHGGRPVSVEKSLEVAGSPEFADGGDRVGVIGRDFLADWILTCDGPRGRACLEAGPEFRALHVGAKTRRVRESRRSRYPHPASEELIASHTAAVVHCYEGTTSGIDAYRTVRGVGVVGVLQKLHECNIRVGDQAFPELLQ